MLDFPSSPIDGQTYSGYVFLNGVWVQSGTLVNTGSPFKRTVFIANTTTFQYDSTTLYADIECLGGGGGGAGCGTGAAAGLAAACGGGGGGGYSKRLITITDAIRAATKTIVVGGGGAPGVSGTPSTYADGSYSLSGSAGATPSSSGVFNATLVHRVGGQGGSGSGGELTVAGSYGAAGQGFGSVQCGAGTAAAIGGNGGNGAGALGGGGGVAGQVTATVTPTLSAGSNGYGYGGGGGGGAAVNAVGSVPTSGAGRDGLVVITEYR